MTALMNKTLYGLIYSLILFCLPTSLFAADNWKNPLQDESNITLQLKWSHQFQFAGYYMAQAKGFYKDAGINITIKPARPGEDPIQQVLNGKAEFGVGTSELLLHFDKGEPIKVLGVIFQHSPLALVSLESSNIDTIADLKGKKVMIEENSSEIYAFLQQSNLSEKNLQILPHEFNIQNLIDKKVDAMTVYTTSETFELTSKNIPYRILSPRMGGIDFYGDNFFTTQSYYQHNQALVEAFRQATIKGWKYAMDHTEEAIDYIQTTYPGLKTTDALRFEANAMQALMRTDLIEPGHMSERRWQHIASVYKELGLLKHAKPMNEFLYNSQETVNRLNHKLSTLLITILLATGFIILTLLLARYFYRLKVQLRTMVNQSPMAIILLNDSLEIIEWNKQATKIFGWEFKEVKNKNIFDFLVVKPHSDKVNQTLLNVISKQQTIHLENKNYTKSGSEISCNWSNAPFNLNKHNYIICMALDTSELRDLKALSMQKSHSPRLQLEPTEKQNSFLALLVEIMQLSITIWEEETLKSKVQFATESNLWRVSLDGSTAKTRTLDKYLSINTIPQNPRWKNVLNTANFMIRTFPKHPKTQTLETLKCQLKEP